MNATQLTAMRNLWADVTRTEEDTDGIDLKSAKRMARYLAKDSGRTGYVVKAAGRLHPMVAGSVEAFKELYGAQFQGIVWSTVAR